MIWRSPHPDVLIPEMTLTNYVLQSSPAVGDKAALVDGPTGRVITYSELASSISRVAAGLSQQGLAKGDVLAICSPNLPEFAIAFHAVARLGGSTTMIPPLFTAEEINKQLTDCKAKFLLTVPPLLDKVRSASENTSVSETFVIGEAEGFKSLASLSGAHAEPPAVAISVANDLVALPYSSGTTAFPKAVMLTHRNMVAMLCQMAATEPILKSDTLICLVPMYHLYGLHIVANMALTCGATVVTLPSFSLNQFLTTLEKYSISVAPLVPPIVLALARAPEVDSFNLSNLRLIHCGAAPLADQVAKACSERLKCEIRYGYGLTEVSPLSHASLPDPKTHRSGSVGFCLPNTECKIVDIDSRTELETFGQGEICIRGPQVMKGYLGNPRATSEMIDQDGWLRSGDIGYVDEDGRLYVVDRAKELIKYKGRQVAPAELEEILLANPAVADAGVIASPDDEAGEVPKAFVVLRAEISGEALMNFVAERVAPYKKIRRIAFIDQIPRTPAGKILRRVLAARDRSE